MRWCLADAAATPLWFLLALLLLVQVVITTTTPTDEWSAFFSLSAATALLLPSLQKRLAVPFSSSAPRQRQQRQELPELQELQRRRHSSTTRMMVYYNDDGNIDNGDNNKNNKNNNNNNVESAISSSSDISTSTVIASTRPEERFEQQGLPTTTTTPKKKIVYGIRHAQSKSNEYMNQPGHDWGEPLFCDDLAFVDSPLSTVGLAQAESLQQQLLLLSSLDGHQNAPNDNNKDNDDKDIKNYNCNWLSNVELVVVSPLTRCLQTLEYGCSQALQKICTNKPMPPMVALPLASERVYSAADIGRPWPVLRDEFPWVDWSWFQPPALAQEPEREPTYYPRNNHHHPNNNDNEKKNPAAWWYTPNNDDNNNNNDDDEYQEWRPPLGLGHCYAVPGEPEGAFQRRMQRLRTWIRQRPEQIILLVTHWGVLNALDNDGTLNPDNVQVCRLELDDNDNDNNDNDNDDDLAAESQGA